MSKTSSFTGRYADVDSAPSTTTCGASASTHPGKPMSSVCPTCRGRGTIRILRADPEPPQIVPCTRCRGTGHHVPATPPPMRDKALRLNNRKPDSVKEWFDLWKNPNLR